MEAMSDALSQVVWLRDVGLPGVAFAGGTGVVCRALLLHCGGRVQVLCCCVALLHVRDRRLRCETDLHRSLRLHLGEFLRLRRVEKIELLHFAIRDGTGIELLVPKCKSCRLVLRAICPVLPNRRYAVWRDRVEHFDDGEL